MSIVTLAFFKKNHVDFVEIKMSKFHSHVSPVSRKAL